MPPEHEEYKTFVELQSRRRPSQIFQNRSQLHATVVIERLFASTEKWIHLVTKNVNPKTYGCPAVVAAAKQLLAQHESAQIVILSEERVDRSTHPFFIALDADESAKKRATLKFIPPEVQRSYKFNFAVNEQQDYRYESNRESHEALVQFGGLEFGLDLEKTFQDLLLTT